MDFFYLLGLAFLVPLGIFAVVCFLVQIVKDAISKSYSLKSFLINLSGNVLATIVGVALIIGGLWLVAKILNSIPVNVLAVAVIAFLVYVCIKGPPPPPHVRKKWQEDIEKGLDEMSLARKEEERDNLQHEIEDLERERDRIPTFNGIILGGSGLSESELQYNRKRVDELDRQIQDKKWELKDLEREIEDKRRELED